MQQKHVALDTVQDASPLRSFVSGGFSVACSIMGLLFRVQPEDGWRHLKARPMLPEDANDIGSLARDENGSRV